MGIQFDWTVNLGHLGAAVLFLSGWIWSYFQLKADVRVIKHDLRNVFLRQDILNNSMTQITTVLQTLAVQEEKFNSVNHRLDTAEEDIRDIQNGVGFKTEKLSGEYLRTGKVHRTG